MSARAEARATAVVEPFTARMHGNDVLDLIAAITAALLAAHRAGAEAARERAAKVAERIRDMMRSGAGEDGPGHRLDQTARLIREMPLEDDHGE